MPRKVRVAIFGGMGPETSVVFHKQFLDACQDLGLEPDIYHISEASIPRRDFGLQGGEDPSEKLQAVLRRFKAWDADFIVAPCNTLMAYRDRLETYNIPMLNIVELNAEYVKRRYPNQTVGILGTRATIEQGLYQKALEANGMEYVVPSESTQDFVMDIIDGVKEGQHKRIKGKQTLARKTEIAIKDLERQGATIVVQGCTELPIALSPEEYHGEAGLIDTSMVLAQAAAATALRIQREIDTEESKSTVLEQKAGKYDYTDRSMTYSGQSRNRPSAQLQSSQGTVAQGSLSGRTRQPPSDQPLSKL